jgi:hypothetical protein
MIGCRNKKMSISRLIDNDLLHDESEQLKRHIQVCKRCDAIYKEYLADENIIIAAFDSESAPAMPVRNVIIHRKFRLFDIRLKPVFPVGAFALLGIVAIAAAWVAIIGKAFTSSYSKPTFIQSSASIMNTPLGSLAYYEDFAGKTVHSQFITLSDKPTEVFDKSNYNQLRYITYSSPLFYDSEPENNRSEAWNTGSVNTISTQD